MKRLLQISNYYYPNIGGIEQVARDIANVVKTETAAEQKLICFNENASDGSIVCHRNEDSDEQIDGVEIIRCGCASKLASQSLSFSFGNRLKETIADFDPDTIIFHYPNPFEAFYLLRQLKKDVRLILYWHLDIIRQKYLRLFFDGQTENLLQRADTIVATSPVYIDGSPYLSRYRDKCTVIPNCIDQNRLIATAESRRRAEEIRKAEDGHIICFAVGRHIPYKGFKFLISASKYLDNRFRICIGGQGELTEQLKAQAAGDSKIRFLGRLSDTDLTAWYSAMDIFCFPSITKNEAFGIALAEAMVHAKPAVTFTIPGSGVNYVCPDGKCGIESPNGDARALAEAILKLGNDPALRERLGQKGKQRVQALFTSDRFGENILKLINLRKET